MRRRENFDRRTLRVRLKPIQLILDREFRRNAAQQRVARLGHDHFKFSQPIVAARAAADERAIEFRPVLPVIPKSGMQADESLTILHVPGDRSFRGIVGPRFVVADDQDIHASDYVH